MQCDRIGKFIDAYMDGELEAILSQLEMIQ